MHFICRVDEYKCVPIFFSCLKHAVVCIVTIFFPQVIQLILQVENGWFKGCYHCQTGLSGMWVKWFFQIFIHTEQYYEDIGNLERWRSDENVMLLIKYWVYTQSQYNIICMPCIQIWLTGISQKKKREVKMWENRGYFYSRVEFKQRQLETVSLTSLQVHHIFPVNEHHHYVAVKAAVKQHKSSTTLSRHSAPDHLVSCSKGKLSLNVPLWIVSLALLKKCVWLH